MTKRQGLYLQRRSRPEQSDQRQPNQAENISHQPRASPDSTSLASRIEFPTMTAEKFRKLTGFQIREKFAAMEMTDDVHYGDVFNPNGILLDGPQVTRQMVRSEQ